MAENRVHKYVILLQYHFVIKNKILECGQVQGVGIVRNVLFGGLLISAISINFVKTGLQCHLNYKSVFTAFILLQYNVNPLVSPQFAGLDLQDGRQQSGGRYVPPHLRNKTSKCVCYGLVTNALVYSAVMIVTEFGSIGCVYTL
jgi:hypothetical protein